VIYNALDIVVVPFPFTDSKDSKRRPAIVLSSHTDFNNEAGHSTMAMITSARNNPWPLDMPIKDLKKSGLPKASVIRMKFFTIDHRLIIEKIGSLASTDTINLRKNIKKIFTDLL